jgi:DNA-binding response OmpR family regulator
MTDDRVLVVEDDDAIGRTVTQTLERHGYIVEWVQSGADAIRAATRSEPSLVILDLGLPDLDGVEVCRRLRDAGNQAPIVMLTARRDEIDVVVGLDAGADDYVTKPFSLAELLARVRAHLRRPAEPGSDHVTVGDLEIDRDARRVWVGDREVQLRTKEFDLLALLAGEAGHALSRERIMHDVWDDHWFGSTRTLDMHISSLRRKLTNADRGATKSTRITTLRGVGYRLEIP